MRKILLTLVAAMCCASMMAGSISEFQKQSNINYVGDDKVYHALDIYFPKEDAQTKHPVIIHIYGSAWASNNMKGSADLSTVGVAALEAGYIFVAPNHRSYNDALFPAQINDIKAVVRYLRGNAEALGIDTSFIAMSGFSSGAHLAVLMGVTRNVADFTVGSTMMDIEGNIGNYTNESSWIHAVCDWSGPIDEKDEGCGVSILGHVQDNLVGCSAEQCPDKHALIGAYAYLDASDAPTMVVHGSSDNVVPICMGQKFYEMLQQTGVDAEWYQHSGEHTVAAEFTDEMITFFNRIRNSHQAIDQVSQDSKVESRKSIKNGALFIERNGRTYNAQGAQVR